jgi:hypothetical protein
VIVTFLGFMAVAYFEGPQPDWILILGYAGVMLALLIYPLLKFSDDSVKIEVGQHGFRDLRISNKVIPWTVVEDARIVVTHQPGRLGTRHFEGIGLSLTASWMENVQLPVMTRVATVGARATAAERFDLWIGVDELDTTPAELLKEFETAKSATFPIHNANHGASG